MTHVWTTKLSRTTCLVGALLLILAGFGRTANVAAQSTPPQLRINPASTQVYTGDTGITRVELDPTLLAGIKFNLTFDPTLLAVQDARPDADGIQIEVDAALAAGGAEIVTNRVDTASGLIEFEVAGLSPDVAAAHVARVTWLGLKEGVAEVTLSNVALTSHGSQPVEYTTQNSVITVTAAQPGATYGRVLLQGRRAHDGSAVYVYDTACPEGLTNFSALDPAVLTNNDGYFEFAPSADKAVACLQVFRQGYLVGQAKTPQGDVGTLTLPGGDINRDNVINIFDMAYIGSRYGDNDPQVDINGDGTVSIFDLVLAASNYGLRGPVTKWQ